MEYKGFKIITNVHKPSINTKTSLVSELIGNKWGTVGKKIYKTAEFEIWHKVINGYRRSGLSYNRLIYIAEHVDQSGVSVSVKFKPYQTITEDIEHMVKKVLCQKVLEVYGIELRK